MLSKFIISDRSFLLYPQEVRLLSVHSSRRHCVTIVTWIATVHATVLLNLKTTPTTWTHATQATNATNKQKCRQSSTSLGVTPFCKEKHSKLTVHCTLCIGLCPVYCTVHCALNIAHCAGVFCSELTPSWLQVAPSRLQVDSKLTVHCTVHYLLHCALFIALCTAHWTLHSVMLECFALEPRGEVPDASFCSLLLRPDMTRKDHLHPYLIQRCEKPKMYIA